MEKNLSGQDCILGVSKILPAGTGNQLGKSGANQNSFTNSFITSAVCTLETLLEVAVVIPHV